MYPKNKLLTINQTRHINKKLINEIVDLRYNTQKWLKIKKATIFPYRWQKQIIFFQIFVLQWIFT